MYMGVCFCVHILCFSSLLCVVSHYECMSCICVCVCLCVCVCVCACTRVRVLLASVSCPMSIYATTMYVQDMH